jgi:hypothetical protein
MTWIFGTLLVVLGAAMCVLLHTNGQWRRVCSTASERREADVVGLVCLFLAVVCLVGAGVVLGGGA